MEKIITKGQFLFGFAITAFGVENLICGGSWICAWHAQQRRRQNTK
jgi:hypothetical protein